MPKRVNSVETVLASSRRTGLVLPRALLVLWQRKGYSCLFFIFGFWVNLRNETHSQRRW